MQSLTARAGDRSGGGVPRGGGGRDRPRPVARSLVADRGAADDRGAARARAVGQHRHARPRAHPDGRRRRRRLRAQPDSGDDRHRPGAARDPGADHRGPRRPRRPGPDGRADGGAGSPIPARLDPRSDQLRLRRVAGPLRRGPPPPPAGRDADGDRQPDRAHRGRLDRGDRAADRLLPGGRDRRGVDHRGDRVGARGGARDRAGRSDHAPGPAPGAAAQAHRLRPGHEQGRVDARSRGGGAARDAGPDLGCQLPPVRRRGLAVRVQRRAVRPRSQHVRGVRPARRRRRRRTRSTSARS